MGHFPVEAQTWSMPCPTCSAQDYGSPVMLMHVDKPWSSSAWLLRSLKDPLTLQKVSGGPLEGLHRDMPLSRDMWRWWDRVCELLSLPPRRGLA